MSNKADDPNSLPKNESFEVVGSQPTTPHSKPDGAAHPEGDVHLHSDSDENVVVSNAAPVAAIAVTSLDVVEEQPGDNGGHVVRETAPLQGADASPKHSPKPVSPKNDPSSSQPKPVDTQPVESQPTEHAKMLDKGPDVAGRTHIPPMTNVWDIGCCLMGVADYQFETTTGCQSSCHVLCCEHTLAHCIPSTERCYLTFGTTGCYDNTRNNACDCWTMLFNLYCFCGYPEADLPAVYNLEVVGSGDQRLVTADGSVIPCESGCCTITSIFLKFPECLGHYTNATCLCFRSDFVSLRPTFLEEPAVVASTWHDLACVLFRGQVVLEIPTTLCKGINQSCCFDTRIALPCDAEVPAMYTCLPFCTVCVNFRPVFACAASVDELLAAPAAF